MCDADFVVVVQDPKKIDEAKWDDNFILLSAATGLFLVASSVTGLLGEAVPEDGDGHGAIHEDGHDAHFGGHHHNLQHAQKFGLHGQKHAVARGQGHA